MTFRKKIALLITILALLPLLNCKYSFRGALPSFLKTIAIPLFEDQSRWVGLQERLTSEVVDAFVRDNTLRVLDEEQEVDLVLKGRISPVQTRKSAIDENELVQEEQIVVSVQVECLNTHTDKPLWNGTVSDFGVVPGDATLDDRDNAVNVAVEKVVAEIVNRTIAAW